MSKKKSVAVTEARYYIAEQNPDGAFLSGVPLRDLTAEEFDALPEWVRASVDAAPFYSSLEPGRPVADADGQAEKQAVTGGEG